MDAGAALSDALDRAGRRRIAVLTGAFLLVGLASVVARQTLFAASFERYLAVSDPAALPVRPEAVRPIPLSLGLGYGVSLALFAVLAVVHEYLLVVALRAFATGAPLREASTRRPVPAVLSGVVVGLVAKTLVAVGLAALVLPGLFLAAALLYAHVRVAVEDERALAALGGSWALTSGRRREALPVIAYLVALYVTPRLVGVVVPGAAGLLVGGTLVAVATVPAVAVVAGSYVRLRDAEPEEQEEDPYARALGPDDLPEPD